MFSHINFPVYRKYKNNQHFFKIISQNSFEEIQIIGNKKTLNRVEAKQLPELNHIYDLLFNTSIADEINENEYLIMADR